MDITKPFTNVFQTDIQVSVTGAERAIEAFFNTYGHLPDTLFVGQNGYPDAAAVVAGLKEKGYSLTRQYAPHYQPEWWSVGQVRPIYGIGSIGCR